MPRQPMSDDEYADTRSRILREAAGIVGQTGIASLSMRNLAERVGLTPGALYRYFPSKQDMLLSFWADALSSVRERIVAIDEAEPHAPAAIRGMLHAYATFCLEDHDRFRLMFLENDQGLGDAFFQRNTDLVPLDVLKRRVEEMIECGSFLRGDPDLLAQTLWAGVHGAITVLITVGEIPLARPEDLLNSTLDALIRGLSVKGFEP